MYGNPPGYPSPEQRRGEKLPPPGLLMGVGSTPVDLSRIPDGILGTESTIDKMKRLAREAYKDERINRLARMLIANCPPRDYSCEANSIFEWMQSSFRWNRLPFHPQEALQRLQTPSETLFDAPSRSGECASLSCALAALLMSVGFRVAYVTAGANAGDPNDFEHVYVSALVNDTFVALDPSYDNPAGWEHPAAKVKRAWQF